MNPLPLPARTAGVSPTHRPLKLLVAGGGTGGHLFPGMAVAEAFCDSDPRNRVLFVNAGRPFEVETLNRSGWPHRRITVEGIKGIGRRRQFQAGMKIPISVWESVGILREFKPDLVLGVGGYSSGPVLAAAALLGIKTVLHEQNSIPGITNRILSRFADRICVSFPNALKTGPLSGKRYREKVRLTGNPIRKAFFLNVQGEENTEAGSSLKPPFRVLIIGGSQGAHAVNRAMTDAAACLGETESIGITHQTGPNDRAEVETAYRRMGISAMVEAFFHDMSRRYREADLLVCRAGATTIAEITAIGKAAIFIPFPYAADDHQMVNARVLADAGAAELIPEKELTGEKLAERIRFFQTRPEALSTMAARARNLGRPDAAERIVDECRRLVMNGESKRADTSVEG